MNTYVKEDNAAIIEICDNSKYKYLSQELDIVTNIIKNIKSSISKNVYFYIAGGYLRDIIAGVNKNDVDITTCDPTDRKILFSYFDNRYQHIFHSDFVDRFCTEEGQIYDLAKNYRNPHQFIYNVAFVNSGIVYDSNFNFFYHSEFLGNTQNLKLKINPSLHSKYNFEHTAFRLGKFYERGYNYYTGNVFDFFKDFEIMKLYKPDIKIIKSIYE